MQSHFSFFRFTMSGPGCGCSLVALQAKVASDADDAHKALHEGDADVEASAADGLESVFRRSRKDDPRPLLAAVLPLLTAVSSRVEAWCTAASLISPNDDMSELLPPGGWAAAPRDVMLPVLAQLAAEDVRDVCRLCAVCSSWRNLVLRSPAVFERLGFVDDGKLTDIGTPRALSSTRFLIRPALLCLLSRFRIDMPARPADAQVGGDGRLPAPH